MGINKKVIVVSLKDWEDKQEVMRKKGQLKGIKIYINHDLSREDRDLQGKFGEIAKQEREREQEAEVLFEFRKRTNKRELEKMETKKGKQWFFL